MGFVKSTLIKPIVTLTRAQKRAALIRSALAEKASRFPGELPKRDVMGLQNLTPDTPSFMSQAKQEMSMPGPSAHVNPRMDVETGRPIHPLDPELSSTIDDVFRRQPEVETTHSRIQKLDLSTGDVKGMIDMPHESVVNLYNKLDMQSMPDMRLESKVPPTAKILSKQPDGSFKYERRKYKSAERPSERVRQVVEDFQAGKKRSKLTQTIETKEGNVKHREILSSKKASEIAKDAIKTQSGKYLPKDYQASEELIIKAQIIDAMWAHFGGKRTLLGRSWETFRQRARGGKPKDAKTYFQRKVWQWMEDPVSFKAKNPRETETLEVMWNGFKESRKKLEEVLGQ